jgi:hypothetical protein
MTTTPPRRSRPTSGVPRGLTAARVPRGATARGADA